ncbi:ABC transporter substrate-binding protein [soil metagenome]
MKKIGSKPGALALCIKNRGRFKAVNRCVMLGLLVACGMAQAAEPPIVVGQSLNLGPDSDGGGLRIEAATKGYIASINAAGGVKGRKIELVSLNDDGDPKIHAKNLKNLAENRGAVAFMNCQDDASCMVATAVASELQVPLVGVMSGLKSLPNADGPWIFRVRPDYEREAVRLGKQLVSMACSRIVIVTDAPGSEPVKVLRASLARESLSVAVLETGSNPAATQTLLKNLEKGPYHAAVMVVSLKTLEGLMDNQITARPEWPRVIVSLSSNHLQTLMAGFKNHSFGFTYVVPNPEILDRPLTQEFQRTMDKYGAGHSSTFVGMEAYVNTKLLVEALQRASRAEPKAVATALRSMDNVDLGGFRVSFSNGAASGSSWIDIGIRSRYGQLLH